MAIRPPIDVASRVSAGLSAAIEALASDPQRKQPPTLEEVRADLQMTGLQWSRNGELLHPQDRTSLLIELDGLIAQYGSKTSAVDFVPRENERGSVAGERGGPEG
jgi:hypothetical protein